MDRKASGPLLESYDFVVSPPPDVPSLELHRAAVRLLRRAILGFGEWRNYLSAVQRRLEVRA